MHGIVLISIICKCLFSYAKLSVLNLRLTLNLRRTCNPGPWSLSEHHLHAMFWLHAYGRSMGSLHVLWLQIARCRMRTLKGSLRFICGHHTGSCGFHTRLGIRLYMRARADAINGLGNIRMISRAWTYGARWGPWATFVLYLPGKTWLYAIWPVGTSSALARRSIGLLPAQNRRKTLLV